MKSCSQFRFPDLQNTSITVDNQTFVSQSIADHPEKSMFTLLYGMIIVVMVVLLLVRAYIFMKVSEFWSFVVLELYLLLPMLTSSFPQWILKIPLSFANFVLTNSTFFVLGVGYFEVLISWWSYYMSYHFYLQDNGLNFMLHICGLQIRNNVIGICTKCKVLVCVGTNKLLKKNYLRYSIITAIYPFFCL